MPATGLLNPSLQFFDDDGAPLAGGLIYTKLAGTSTNATTYFDSDLDPSHANTNPIELDSAGRCVIFLDPAHAYKILVHDADDVSIYTQDDISVAAIAE